jgi:hypothetical protein
VLTIKRERELLTAGALVVVLGRKYNYANDKERRELLIIGVLGDFRL